MRWSITMAGTVNSYSQNWRAISTPVIRKLFRGSVVEPWPNVTLQKDARKHFRDLIRGLEQEIAGSRGARMPSIRLGKVGSMWSTRDPGSRRSIWRWR